MTMPESTIQEEDTSLGDGIPAEEPTAEDAGIPDEQSSMPSGIPEKPTTAKVSSSTKTLVAGVKYGDESFDDTVRRIVGSWNEVVGHVADLESDNEHLKTRNNEIAEELSVEQAAHAKTIEAGRDEIAELRYQLAQLTEKVETAVATVGGQASLDSFGVKDVIEEARDMCGGDDTECLKIAGKMMDVKLHFASKAVDHEHASEQNRLDRELKEDLAGKERGEKAKDREFREKLTTQEQQNKIELQLLKKGIVKKSVLEDAAFVNISSVPKQPKKVIAEKKKQAFHETEDEETYDYDPEETTDDHTD